jgi:AcrR family transcriptional regulator
MVASVLLTDRGSRTAKPLTPAGERILTAASSLFYERGIRTVGVDAIADAAEVTKKTLYDRFGSKDNLIAAYLEQRNRVWHLFLDEQLRVRAPQTPEEVILALFAALTDWMAESRRGCGFINASVELAAPDHPAMPVIVAQKQWMRAEFLAQAERAGFRSTEELADRLLLLHEGALVTYRVAAMEHAPEVAYRAAADLLAGWPRD